MWARAQELQCRGHLIDALITLRCTIRRATSAAKALSGAFKYADRLSTFLAGVRQRVDGWHPGTDHCVDARFGDDQEASEYKILIPLRTDEPLPYSIVARGRPGQRQLCALQFQQDLGLTDASLGLGVGLFIENSRRMLLDHAQYSGLPLASCTYSHLAMLSIGLKDGCTLIGKIRSGQIPPSTKISLPVMKQLSYRRLQTRHLFFPSRA